MVDLRLGHRGNPLVAVTALEFPHPNLEECAIRGEVITRDRASAIRFFGACLDKTQKYSLILIPV